MMDITNKAIGVSNRMVQIEEQLACGDRTVREADDLRHEYAELEEWNEVLNTHFKLRNEIEALRAQVEQLQKALNDQLNDCINFDGAKLTDCIMEHSTKVLKATPQQYLAEVRVQERRCGFVAGYNSGWASKSLGKSFSPEWSASNDAYDYANQIRQQAQDQ